MSSIPLHHSSDNQGYRLIELPPNLQSLLESDNPPILTLESSHPSALLKTPSGTYSLRQKNTSNSVVLLSCRPCSSVSSDGDNTIELAAISTIKETVELHPLPQHAGAETPNPQPAETKSKRKWHEKFGSSR